MPRRPRKPVKWHGGRAMLNRPGFQSTAAIVAEIEDSSSWEDGKDGDGDAYAGWTPAPRYVLQISDCDRSISWDMDFGTSEGRKNNLHKLDTMIRVLSEFRTGLALENREYERRARQAARHQED